MLFSLLNLKLKTISVQSEVWLLSNSSCNSADQLICYARENPLGTLSYATTTSGRRYPDLINAQTVGKWGSPLLSDIYLIEKMQKMSRERIPPRIAHAKASGS